MDRAPVKSEWLASSAAADKNGEANVAGTRRLTLVNQPPSVRLVFALAWPVWVQQLLVFGVNLSDRFLAGHFQPGDTTQHVAYQSAQNTALYLSWFVVSFTVIVTVGSTALVSRFVGAGNRNEAIHATNQSILLALVLGIVGSTVGMIVLPGALELLQLKGFAAEFAGSHLRPLLLLLVFQVVQAVGIACLVGAGDTRTGMWILALDVVLNIPLAWTFFHGIGPIPALGFQGIAWGTALSYLVGGTTILIVLARGRAGLKLRLHQLFPDPRLLWRLLRISVPAAADSLSASFGQLFFLSIINRLGDVAGSAHGVALTWEAITFLSGQAFGTAAMTLVGQNLGAGRPDEARKSGWIAFALGCSFMSTMGIVCYLLAEQLFFLFCPNPEQREVIKAGVPVLQLIAAAMPALASCMIFTSALRGAGDTRIPVLFTLVGFFAVRIPLACFLSLPEVSLGPLGTWPGLNLGLIGAWIAMVSDLVVRGTFLFFRWVGGRWQKIRV